MATNADLYAMHRYQRVAVLARCTGIAERLRSDYPIEWLDQKCVGPACAKWAGGITHHGPATTSPAGFCAMGQPSQPLIAGTPPERR